HSTQESVKRELDEIELFASQPQENNTITYGAFASWYVTVKGKSTLKPMQLYYITLEKEGDTWVVSDMVTPEQQHMEGERKERKKDLRNIAKHFIRKKLFVGTISFIVANIIPVFIFLILSTLLLAMIGALSGSVNDQKNGQREIGENGLDYVCSPTGDINQKAWYNYFKDKDKSGVFAEYGDDIVEIAEEKGIDPVLFGAIALHETAYGTSSGVLDKNNPGGLMNPSTNMQSLQRFS